MESTNNDSIFGEIIGFARTRKKLWLVPLIFLLLSLGAVLVVLESSALSPFIYSLF